MFHIICISSLSNVVLKSSHINLNKSLKFLPFTIGCKSESSLPAIILIPLISPLLDPLVDVVTSLPAGRVAKAAVNIGKGLGKALKPDLKDPIERFDILEPLPEKEEKETTEERTRGQINNLFDSPLGS